MKMSQSNHQKAMMEDSLADLEDEDVPPDDDEDLEGLEDEEGRRRRR